jgi:hypothetical protein
VATPNSGGTFQVHFNRIDKTDTIAVPNTTWWQSWLNTTPAVITLDPGPQIMTFVRKGNADFNLNRLTLTYIGNNGDMDLDGDIDMADFALFVLYWQQTGCGTCGGADLTGDGNVWMDDLKVFCNNWMDGL